MEHMRFIGSTVLWVPACAGTTLNGYAKCRELLAV
jgi:hypothetical protein